MLRLHTYLSAHPTALAGLGLLGLAAYDASVGDYHSAGASLLAALAAFGFRGKLLDLLATMQQPPTPPEPPSGPAAVLPFAPRP